MQTLIHAFAGIGRGNKGLEAIEYMAQQVRAGVIHIEQVGEKVLWVYQNDSGTRMISGEIGDPVIPLIAKLAVTLHAGSNSTNIDYLSMQEKLLEIPKRVWNAMEALKINQ